MADVQITITTVDKTSAAINDIRSQFKNLEAGVEQLEKSTKELNPQLAKTAQELEDTSKGAKGAQGALKGLKQSYMDIRFAVMDFARIAAGAWNFAKEGAQIELQQGRFERLAESIGTTSDALTDELTVAMRGMMSDADAMAMATDFMSLGLAKTSDQVVRLAAVSSGLNMDMNQLVLTLANKTTMRFDQLGVAVDGFDERLKGLIDSGMDVNDAFTEAFLQQAEAQITKIGNAADTSAGQFAILEATWKNLAATAKETAADMLLPAVTAANQMTIIYEKVKEYGAKWGLTWWEAYKEIIEGRSKSDPVILGPPLPPQAEMGPPLPPGWIDQINEAKSATWELGLSLRDVLEASQGEYKFNFLINYAEQYDDVAEKIAEKEAELAALRAGGWSETGSKIQGVKSEIEALQGSMTTAANQMVLDLLKVAITADGIITPEEIDAFFGLGAKLGLVSDEAAAAAKAAWDEANAVLRGEQTELMANTETEWRTTADTIIGIVNEIPNKVRVVVEQEGNGGGYSGDSGWQGEGGNFASGGFAKGRFVVGDAPGGGWTPYTEIVDAPQGAKVYSNAASRRMRGSMPGYAGGTDGNMEAMFDRLANRIIVGVRDAVQQVA